MQFVEAVPGIKVLRTPFSGSWSGVTLVRGNENLLIDSGASATVVDEVIVPALQAEGLTVGDISWLLNTHCHGDHIGGHARLRQLGVKNIATITCSADKLGHPLIYSRQIRARFPEHSPPPPAVLNGVEADLLLNDGDLIGRLRLIHTPGHDTDTVSWLDEQTGTLICGDSLQANGTELQGVGFYQDLPAYRATLERLTGMKIDNLVAGHDYLPYGALAIGPAAVSAFLSGCLAITYQYDREIKNLWTQGVQDPVTLAKRLIQTVNGQEPAYLFLPLYTVTEHIKHAQL
ncbi:MAG: MBL fold metallo-hydrolase [Clostridiaceae bacterium]|nr:MBL fold metallo-hydrolase [Clostridiaceae bacterium]